MSKKYFSIITRFILYSSALISIVTAVLPLSFGEIHFHTDIARDFLLFDEIAKKKIVLIGPRASGLQGFFHGPLWLYLNMPFYILGHGNPVIVGWGWIVLTVIFLYITYLLSKNHLSKKTSISIIILFLAIFARHIKGLYNPYGALFLVIPFIFSLFSYLESGKEKYLFLSFFILGAMIQFQIAVAIPLLIASLPLVFYFIFKKKVFIHIRSILSILVFISSYIVFDLRHKFQLLSSILKYVTGKTNVIPLDTKIVIKQRLSLMSTRLVLFQNKTINFMIFIIILFTVFYILILNKKGKKLQKNERLFVLGVYFYISFYIISIVHKGWLLGHYYLPILAIPIMLTGVGSNIQKVRKIYKMFLLLSLIYWTVANINYNKNIKKIIGTSENSWIYQSKVAKTVFEQKDKEFGFFIFSPDILAYQSKAAMNYYINKNPNIKVAIYQKRPITYLIIAPPPPNQPWLNEKGWKKLKVKLVKQSEWTKTIPPVGYKVEKYLLTKEDLKISPDPNINDWVYFR